MLPTISYTQGTQPGKTFRMLGTGASQTFPSYQIIKTRSNNDIKSMSAGLISVKSNNILFALGGSLPTPLNLTQDNLDNAAAVDKGTTSPATVGIPITGHSYLAGQQVTISGSTAYNFTYEIDSVSTNEIVIVSAFTAETFAGTEAITTALFGHPVTSGSDISLSSVDDVETFQFCNAVAASVAEITITLYY